MQEHEGAWKPVSFSSRAMSETECHYAQIEKEALAMTWACEKFRSYLLGLSFTLETDHKLFVALISTKSLNSLPPRLICFRLRLSSFSYVMQHVPGKLLYTADTLSRAPMTASANSVIEEVEEFVSVVVAALPASPHRLKDYCEAQKQDPTCQEIRQFCQTGWPCKEKVAPRLKPYWRVKECEDLLLFSSRIVIPQCLQHKTLEKIHQGHQGIERCLQRIRSSVWWPGITSQLKQMVEHCHTCAKRSRPRKEPLIPTELPEYPWQVVGMDLFEIPDVDRSDNGPQYSSHEFAVFADSYGFQHCTH